MPTLDITRTFPIFSKHGIRRAALFGSYAKGSPSADSDVDLIVEFEPDKVPDLFSFIGIKQELERELGKRVDCVMHDAVDKYFRDEILSSAKDIYVRS